MFPQIEKLKQEYTDKYVLVADRPELARFQGFVGQVKTVNMSGRALVQFDAWNNIGWYDIDPACLTIVPKPEPKPAEKAEKAKPAPKAAVNKKEDVIGEKPVAAPAGKKSTADILAAARGKAPAAPAAKPAAGAAGAKAKPSTADILAAARGKAPAAAAPAAPAQPKPAAAPVKPAAPAGKLSTADILAAARAGKATAEPEPGPAAEETTAPVAAAPAAPAKAAAKPAAGGALPTSTADKIAWCRTHDAK